MKKIIITLVVAGLLFLGAGIALSNHHAIKIENKAGIGKYLTDTEGNTLYYFKKDCAGKSYCDEKCVEIWPIYYREKVAVPKGISEADFGTITRDDGKKQTTFRGYAVYYYTGDKKAGDTSGQNFKKSWFVINPDKLSPKVLKNERKDEGSY